MKRKRWTIWRLRKALQSRGMDLVVGGEYGLGMHRAYTSVRDGERIATEKDLCRLAELHELDIENTQF